MFGIVLFVPFCWIADGGADLSEFCACSCAGLEGIDPLSDVSIRYARVTGEDETTEGWAMEAGGRGEGMARPEKELSAE